MVKAEGREAEEEREEEVALEAKVGKVGIVEAISCQAAKVVGRVVVV